MKERPTPAITVRFEERELDLVLAGLGKLYKKTHDRIILNRRLVERIENSPSAFENPQGQHTAAVRHYNNNTARLARIKALYDKLNALIPPEQ